MHIMSLITVNENNFNQALEESNLVLVDFWAPWCGPCKMIAPILDQLNQESAGAVTIAKLNVDDNPSLASQYGVMSIPTLKLFKDGKEVETIVGLQPLENLKKLIQKHA
jgi:thioredoxin 1